MTAFCVGLVLWSVVLWTCVLLVVMIRDISVALCDGCRAVPRLVWRLLCLSWGRRLVSLLRARRARLSNRRLLADHT